MKIIKIACLMIKSYCNHSKDLKVIVITYVLNKSIKLQTFNKITTYPFGKNAFKVCESEMLSKI